MAIRLIDQYPNRAGVPNADYPHGVPRNKSTPTSTDGTPFEQAWFRDQEGFFQGLLETAGITPSGSPDTVEQSDYFDALVQAMHGVTEVDVGGADDVTLGVYPSRVAALRLTGTLGADVDLIVPNTERLYTVIDETTGGFSVTVRTAAGTGVTLADETAVVRSDGTNVVYYSGLSATTTLKGVVEKATLTESLAGEEDKFPDAAGVKAAIINAFDGDNQSLSENGYQIFPGGLIIQWGRVSSDGASGVITTAMPIAFPNAFLFGVALDNGLDTDKSVAGAWDWMQSTLSEFAAYWDSAPGDWGFIAIGY